jgi:tetratricopeptide (TPR) repeat protein
MIRQEFDKAVEYLALAYQLAPSHRGIIKSLGYCYLWLGDMDTAQGIFIQFPEVRNELDAYQSWWQNQDRADLVEKTNIMIRRMDAVSSQP